MAESGTRSETTGYNVGLEEIPAHEHYALVDISEQDLEDSVFDLEAEMQSEFAEQFAKAEGSAFVSGNGWKTRRIHGQQSMLVKSTLVMEQQSQLTLILTCSHIKSDYGKKWCICFQQINTFCYQKTKRHCRTIHVPSRNELSRWCNHQQS